ncbi:uncharacterized protein LOC114517791 isoform X1 [Dendronephthya gigantea]|uniref:uncharacterized protein LOC114517791 isoform X1 n=1 Tax=Dendronephthya gigantea TaxID=151771 RepID=UPI00106C480A|nr:uncharacterized protein LOC114517791 isoform X1 [Dendronephthya gigantea]
MCSGKILESYFLSGLIVTLLCFASGKFNSRTTDRDQLSTDKHNLLQHLTDDDTLITTLEKPPRKSAHFTNARHSKITKVVIKNSDKKSSKWRENKLRKFREKKKSSRNRFIEKSEQSKNWLGRFIKEKGNSRKVIHRKSRDDGSTYEDDDNEDIRSKDEEEDEDVQLIIIPRKPRKHLQPKVRVQDVKDTNGELQVSENTESDSENDNKVSGNSVDDSEKYPEISNSDNDDVSDSENLQNSGKIFKKPKRFHQKHLQDKSKNANDDATLTLERVAPERDDDDDSKNSHQSDGGDYDLHLKVKDKSGTKVKLSGDLPGNIGNLMAVGEDGGKVVLKNTGENSEESSDVVKSVKLQDGIDDATTDKLAQSLIKIKSGKFKHSPYPSTVLLKPNGGINESPKLPDEDDSNQSPTLFKSPSNDGNSIQEPPANKLTSLARDEADAKAEPAANQQPGDNIFAPMEFENGDDELMATSRLLDIAQKVDDVSSLKDVKDSSNTVKERPSRPAKSLKELTNDMEVRRTSKAFLKSTTIPSKKYSEQSEDIEDESNNNWYKMQSLEDRVVNEGTTARAGKDVGYYNGQEVSVVSPGQLQLLQTEYPSYPAYLTPLLRTNFTKKA